ncbi:major facilitator transporter [Arsukibacterium ikkense]|uniref:Major facilitator transporter n=1 Tax=Arsukibacterium ikkense TaxID=336831 RepID=A0A0M2V643_9GAMM|nr:sugar MFS transporter [Arsukibacterium ikkense]KKO46317.1 major facilitator transporter [Arsukibacterium ikkense]
MDTSVARPVSTSSVLPMTIIGILFFIFGFVTWLNGSLIPFLKIVCDLNEFQALFVTGAFYIAYVVMALPMSFVLNRVGYKNGMVVGLLIMAIGAVMFIPAAQTSHYALFLIALFVLGTGLTILQTASNPYIVCIGPRESAAMRISIMGLVNKGAGFIVPIVFTAWVLTGMDQFAEEALAVLTEAERSIQLAELSNRLVTPYIYMTVALLLLAAFIKFSPLPELNLNGSEDTGAASSSWTTIFSYPQLVLGVVALFVYVGVEVIAGDTIGLYGQGLGVAHFGALTSYTMAFMVLGYLVGVFCIPKYLSQERALQGSAVVGLLFTLGVMFGSNDSSLIANLLFGWSGIPVVPDTVMFLALLGFANALVWPAVWPLALQGLGKLTSTGSALLIMGIAGGAILPMVYGYLAHSSGNSQFAYWMMLPCYAFILFYAFKGHALRRWR